MVYSARRFVVCLALCHFVLVFFSPFSIAITSLGEERANLSSFRTFVRFVLVWICRFRLLLVVWEGLRFVIVALPGLFSYLFWMSKTILKVIVVEPFVLRNSPFTCQQKYTKFVVILGTFHSWLVHENLAIPWIAELDQIKWEKMCYVNTPLTRS